MTRKEKEKILLDGLGLKVGDKIKVKYFLRFETLEIEEETNCYSLLGKNGDDECRYGITILVGEDFEKVKEPKRYKDMKCDELDCMKCPLAHISGFCKCRTPQEKLDSLELDPEEREFYQKRINREYKEEE